jgi:hypothetical protein
MDECRGERLSPDKAGPRAPASIGNSNGLFCRLRAPIPCHLTPLPLGPHTPRRGARQGVPVALRATGSHPPPAAQRLLDRIHTQIGHVKPPEVTPPQGLIVVAQTLCAIADRPLRDDALPQRFFQGALEVPL